MKSRVVGKSLVTSALVLSLAAVASWAAASDPVVSVTGGRIKGSVLANGDVAVFKGIPFAAPPEGALRWRAPQPVAAWQGVRDAKEFGASCAQEVQDWDRQEATGNKEDCLYLNVWSSDWSAKTKKPVMVWIHGGGNTGGGAKVDYFDGASLSRKGVVVVTINYRLGLFGFFAHPALTAESKQHASGDYGLLDQVAALKWVHDNIARLGGDPGNVTLFGQSAGSADTAILMASPLAKGLFHRAIQESGAANRDMASLHEAEQQGEKFAASLKAPAGKAQIAYLRSLTPEQLLKALKDAPKDAAPNIGPSIDGWFMPVGVADVMAQGKEHAIPLIIGSNAQEQRGPKPDALRKEIAIAFGANTDKALAYYGLNGAGEGNTDPLYGPATQQFWADSRQRCGAVQEASWHANAKNPVYEYQFDRAIPGRAATNHSAELEYVFGTLLPAGFLGGPYGETDRKIADTLQTYWTNFAKTGNPNGAGMPAWAKYDPAARAYLEFTDNGPVQKAALRKEICDLYIENFAHGMKGAGERG
jgi:para-nitrobenzyl esterase